jgi:hypothetical protein
MSRQPKSAATDECVGSWFGDHRIESLIGRGEMRTAYGAIAGDATPIGLKLVKADLARDETFRRDLTGKPYRSAGLHPEIGRECGCYGLTCTMTQTPPPNAPTSRGSSDRC